MIAFNCLQNTRDYWSVFRIVSMCFTKMGLRLT